MNRAASDALTSAENTAARPIAPTTGGSMYIRIIGNGVLAEPFAAVKSGNRPRAMMPRSAGTAAYTNSPSAFSPTPTRTARSSRAPKTF